MVLLKKIPAYESDFSIVSASTEKYIHIVSKTRESVEKTMIFYYSTLKDKEFVFLRTVLVAAEYVLYVKPEGVGPRNRIVSNKMN